MPSLSERIKIQAATLGFNRLGIIPAAPSPTLDHYLAWIETNMHGSMGYLARADRVVRRQDLNIILDGVQSLIIVGLDYRTWQPPAHLQHDPLRGRISCYAWGVDYHELMLPRLHALAEWLQAQLPTPMMHRAYVDTGAILERSHAQQAGLGFIGKNTMLIHPRGGSYFFLGEILTTLNFETLGDNSGYDKPIQETMCGTCQRCLVACPTQAFPRPFVLDARRCISYLTIEHKSDVPLELRSQMANWVYGCDVCQEVCPWNRFAAQTLETDFFPIDENRVAPPLSDLLHLTDKSFQQQYADSPILRIKRERLVRNACIAAGNSQDATFLPILHWLVENEPSALIQRHAHWASESIEGRI